MNIANHPFTNHRVDRRLKIPAYFSTSLLQCHNFYTVRTDGNRNEGGLHGCYAAYQYIMFVFHVIVPPPPSYFFSLQKNMVMRKEERLTMDTETIYSVVYGTPSFSSSAWIPTKAEKLCSSLMFCGHFLDEIQHALLFVNVRW